MTDVAMVGPAEGESGVGDYLTDLTSEMPDERVRRVDAPTGGNSPGAFVRCAIRAGTADVDVIHVQQEYGLFGTAAAMSWIFFPVLYLLAALRGIPVVVTIHEGLNGELVVPPLRRLKRVYVYALNRLIVLHAAEVVFLSENTADEFTESVSLAAYTVFPHGAHNERALELDRSEAKRRLGFDPDQTVITEPGYVEPRKGSDRLVDLASRMSEYEFVLAGGPAKPSYEEYCEQIEAEAPPNLTLTGFLEEGEFHASFIASDVIVLPYQAVEQAGIVNTVNQSGIVNRCATYERPVVASDLPYFEDIEAEWRCLLTCDFDDAEDAAETITAVLTDARVRERLSERMAEYAEANSFAAVAERHQRLYDAAV